VHVDDCGEAYVTLAEHTDRSAVAGQFFNISAYKYETAEIVLHALAREYGFVEGASFISGSDRTKAEDGMALLFGFSQWVGSDKIRKITGWRDRQMLFSENLPVYRRSYEAAVAMSHGDIGRIKARQDVWHKKEWQPE
jgi:nucleoside-diphosphate-sugar epimerase